MSIRTRRLSNREENILNRIYAVADGRFAAVSIGMVIDSMPLATSFIIGEAIETIYSLQSVGVISLSIVDSRNTLNNYYRITDEGFWYCEEVLKCKRPERSIVKADVPPPPEVEESQSRTRGVPNIDLGGLYLGGLGDNISGWSGYSVSSFSSEPGFSFSSEIERQMNWGSSWV